MAALYSATHIPNNTFPYRGPLSFLLPYLHPYSGHCPPFPHSVLCSTTRKQKEKTATKRQCQQLQAQTLLSLREAKRCKDFRLCSWHSLTSSIPRQHTTNCHTVHTLLRPTHPQLRTARLFNRAVQQGRPRLLCCCVALFGGPPRAKLAGLPDTPAVRHILQKQVWTGTMLVWMVWNQEVHKYVGLPREMCGGRPAHQTANQSKY
eukprot:351099-Chlamydomonas_euryale.AAC.1